MNIRVELLKKDETTKEYEPTNVFGTLIWLGNVAESKTNYAYVNGMVVLDDGTFKEIWRFKEIRAVWENK